MSCNIAIVFHKKIYNNNFYVDGAFSDKFPILFANKMLTDEKYTTDLQSVASSGDSVEFSGDISERDTLFTKPVSRGGILGINIETDDTFPNKLAEDTDFITYLRQILSISYHTNKSLTEGFKSKNIDVITIHTKTSGISSGLTTTINRSKKYELFNEGFNQVENIIKQSTLDKEQMPHLGNIRSTKSELCSETTKGYVRGKLKLC